MSSDVGQTEDARARRAQGMQLREMLAESFVAILFFLCAGLLFAIAPSGPVDWTDFALLVVAAAVLGRLEFEIGTWFAVPTQLVFVPMLFVLPPAIVPLAVVSSYVLDRIPDLLRGRWHPQRVLNSVSDAWYSLGPALVFVLAGITDPGLEHWPVFALALGAQFVGDLGSSTARHWLIRGRVPETHFDIVQKIWTVDLLLSSVGLLAAYAATMQPRGYLLVLPIAGLIPVFSRERHERIGQAIELSAAYRGTAMLLGDVLSADDEYTGVHSQGVVVLALTIADELEVDAEQRRLVEFGAMLHDIGKITTPQAILNKPGPLDDEEWAIMRRHTIEGQKMLDRVGGTLHEVGVVVRASHERYDGGGYPDALAGDEIPFAARIVAVADAYNAMTTRRPYRAPLTQETALGELRANEGKQFDPVVVAAALAVVQRSEAAAQRAGNGSTAHTAAGGPITKPDGKRRRGAILRSVVR